MNYFLPNVPIAVVLLIQAFSANHTALRMFFAHSSLAGFAGFSRAEGALNEFWGSIWATTL